MESELSNRRQRSHTDAGSLAGNDCSMTLVDDRFYRAHRRRLLMTAVATAVIAPVASAAGRTGTTETIASSER